ncbi:hypothetical protein GCM10010404_76200 [Nonomuraea africana]
MNPEQPSGSAEPSAPPATEPQPGTEPTSTPTGDQPPGQDKTPPGRDPDKVKGPKD